MFAVRFLRPVRAPIAAVFSCPSGGATPSFGKSDFFKAWIKLEAVNCPELCTLAKSSFKSVALRKPFEYAQKLRDSGELFKPPQAKTVEVEDYTFLCLARVEIKDKKLVLIGILGGWWILPLSYSSQKEVLLFDKSWKELASLVKSRFRYSC